MRYITHFESAIDGTTLPADRLQTMHADRPLWSRYDLEAVAQVMTKEVLKTRRPDMWRYRELLPIGDEIEPVSLKIENKLLGESAQLPIACITFSKVNLASLA